MIGSFIQRKVMQAANPQEQGAHPFDSKSQIRPRSAKNGALSIYGRTWTSVKCGVKSVRASFSWVGSRVNFTYLRWGLQSARSGLRASKVAHPLPDIQGCITQPHSEPSIKSSQVVNHFATCADVLRTRFNTDSNNSAPVSLTSTGVTPWDSNDNTLIQGPLRRTRPGGQRKGWHADQRHSPATDMGTWYAYAG
jgi:hypothetical protein